MSSLTPESIRPSVDDETCQEWIDALRSMVREEGKQATKALLDALDQEARVLGVGQTKAPFSAYQNTISLEDQPSYPGHLELEQRITSMIRWNALAMVVRANQAYGELGGHIASYASCAEIFEVGFNHFFRARTDSLMGIWCIFNLTQRLASMHAPIWKIVCQNATLPTIGKRFQGKDYAHTPTPG